MPVVRRVLASAALVAAIGASGCGGNEGESDSEAENPAGISPAEFDAVQEGTPDEEIEAQFGEPTSRDEAVNQDFGKGACWIYGVLGEPTYQFCFVDGELVTKQEF
jgi:hypothetical protein